MVHLRLLVASSACLLAASQTTYGGSAAYALNQSCGTTCSPSFCQTVSTAPTCNFTRDNGSPLDYVAQVATFQCNSSCTQNKVDPRCSASALRALMGNFAGVKAAYCNAMNLVILSDGSPGFLPNLQDVINPPGSIDDSGTKCVTRKWSRGFEAWKIPLSNVYQLLSTSTRMNNANTNAFPGGPGESGYLSSPTRGTYGLPTRGSVGVTVAGQSIFPVFNNRAELTPEACEIDGCNEHVGGGGGAPHLHGDPFGSKCLYSPANYSSLSDHPPQIGWSLDGPSIYGRYLSTSAPGYGTALDDCGGHVHDSYPYHYHASVKSAVTDSGVVEKSVQGSSVEYAAFPPGVDQCWKADISLIPGFWDASQGPSPYNKPCCGMTDYYAAPGITIPTTAGSGGGGGGGGGGASCTSGTCTGTDNTGRACPPTFGPSTAPCPPGCTSVCPTTTTAAVIGASTTSIRGGTSSAASMGMDVLARVLSILAVLHFST